MASHVLFRARTSEGEVALSLTESGAQALRDYSIEHDVPVSDILRFGHEGDEAFVREYLIKNYELT